jgi:SNF2 family DNA or RNA helicase
MKIEPATVNSDFQVDAKELLHAVISTAHVFGVANGPSAASTKSDVTKIEPTKTSETKSEPKNVIDLVDDDDDDAVVVPVDEDFRDPPFKSLRQMLDDAAVTNKKPDDEYHSPENRVFKKARLDDDDDIDFLCIDDDDDDNDKNINNNDNNDDDDDDNNDDFGQCKPGTSLAPARYVNSTTDHASLVPDNAKPYVLDDSVTPPVSIPAQIAHRLRPYQREGVEFLYRRCVNENSGAILGDDMGMGKTIQSIAFLSALLRVGDERRAPGFMLAPDRSRPVALIVLPASVIMQWEAEIKKWSTLRVISYQGSERRHALHSIVTRRSDVLLMSYEMLRTNREQIEQIKWTCIIFDEIHRLKNIHSKLTIECSKLDCKARVGLTGTVMQNNFEELHGIINFVAPGHLGPYRTFKHWFVDPIVNGQDFSAEKTMTNKGRHAARRLHAKLQDVMLRRKKELISEELPGKEDNIVFCNLTDLQRRMYERALSVPEVTLLRRLVDKCACGSGKLFGTCCGVGQSGSLASGGTVDWKKEVLRTINRLNNLANHPVLLSPQARDPADKRDRDATFEAHVLGSDAVAARNATLDGNHALLSGKMRVLSALLQRWSAEVPRNKVLIFSRSTRTLDMLGSFLTRLGILHLRLDGSTTNKRRDQLVAQFQSVESPQWVFLVSTRAGGLGLNLTAANIVVVFDPNWNHTWDLQAQDRAYRIGQTRYTRVYRFVSTSTIEELLYVRQIYKQQFSTIAQEGAKERRFFDRDDMFGMRQLLMPVTNETVTGKLLDRTQPRCERLPSVGVSAMSAKTEPSVNETFFRIERESVTDGGLHANGGGDNGESAHGAHSQSTAAASTNAQGNAQMTAVFDEPVTEVERADLAQYERDIQTLHGAGVTYYHAHDKVVGVNDKEMDGPANEAWVAEFQYATNGAGDGGGDGGGGGGLFGSAAALFAGMASPSGGGSGVGSSRGAVRSQASVNKARIKRKRSAKLLLLSQKQQEESMRSLFGTSSTFMQAHQRSLQQQQQMQQPLQPMPQWRSPPSSQDRDGAFVLDLTDGEISPPSQQPSQPSQQSSTSSHSPLRAPNGSTSFAAFQQHMASGPPRTSFSSTGAFTGMFPAPARAMMGRSLSTGSLISLGSMTFGEADPSPSPIGLPAPSNYSPPVVSLLDSPVHPPVRPTMPPGASVVVSDED